jgi:hypothetical protein
VKKTRKKCCEKNDQKTHKKTGCEKNQVVKKTKQKTPKTGCKKSQRKQKKQVV